jgi:undecaprenyl-diphosphatase
MNETIFYFFYDLTHQSAFFDKVVLFTADIFPYLVIVLAGIFLIFYHKVFFTENPIKVFIQKWKEISFVFFSSILAWLSAYVLKFIFHTPRPFDVFPQINSLFRETGYAFPSGHATFFMALAVALFFLDKKVGYVFIFFALLIGIARIMAGVHFPIDILGGFMLGFAIAFFLKNV